MSTHSLPLPGRWRRDAASAPGASSASGGGTAAAPAARQDDSGRTSPRRGPGRPRLRRFVRGAENDPAWARPALLALLAATAVLYFWSLTASGYANEFYAAAVKSASMDWKAWLFGSLDSANAITVDKPPAALWVMGLSARLFGFSSLALLAPQALMGVATVGFTAAAVRRWHGHAAGLLAGALVALTPVAALMFRFDNPDALLTLLMTGAAYLVVRAVDADRRRVAVAWLAGAGVALGFAFLTKMLQGLLVLPAFGLAYLLAARWSLGARIRHLGAALAALVVGAGWFVALVSLWPADARPYVGGSTNNSLWELAVGYNGLGRILGGAGNGGGAAGGAGMGGANTGFGGAAGLLRMANTAFGGEISWLLPAALILLLGGLLATARRPRGDRFRASLVLWGGWMLVTTLVFSFMSGTVHPYYAVALAPAIAATVAVGGAAMWERRARLPWRVVLAAAVAATGVWSFVLLRRDASGWLPWLAWVVLVGAGLGSMAYVAFGTEYEPGGRPGVRRTATIALLVGALAALGGTAAWTGATVVTAHGGSIPTSGPAVAGGDGPDAAGMTGMGGFGGAGGTSVPGGQAPQAAASGQSDQSAQSAQAPAGTAGATGGPMGAGPGDQVSNAALDTLLDNAGTRWSAVVIGDQSAQGYILDTNTAVMAIGGWGGSDNAPTLTQFEQYVASGQIHYFIASGQGGGMGGPGGSSDGSASAITTWVQAHFTATTVGGVTVYDLTQQTS